MGKGLGKSSSNYCKSFIMFKDKEAIALRRANVGAACPCQKDKPDIHSFCFFMVEIFL